MSKRFLLSLAAIVLAGEAFASGMPPQVTVTSAPTGTQINTLPSSNPAGTSDTVAFPFQGVTGGVPLAVQSGSVVTGQASLTVGSSTGSVALGSAGPVVQVYNPGSAVVYVKLGSSSVTAATTDTPVAPGSYLILNTGGVATYIAAIAPTGTPTLTITTGTGTPLGWGGSSGGGGSAITTWAGGTLGAMANYGTSPGAVLVPGMNAFVTNAITVTQGTAAGSGPWITTPWIAGAVNSATNGLYNNTLQGNAVLSVTNGLYSNILQGNAVLTGANPIFSEPAIAGAVNSATNGLYVNNLQGNAVLSATNGTYANLLQGNAVLSATNPIFTTGSIAGAAVSATNGGYVNLLQGNAVNASGNPIFAQVTAGSAAIGNVGGFESGAVTATSTPANSSHAAGQSIGGLFTMALARTNGGSGIITQFAFKSTGASVGSYVARIWSKNPTGTTCTDNSAFVGSDTDDAFLVTAPFGFTPAAPLVTTGDSATYAALTNLVLDYKNNDSSPGTNLYVCVITVATNTADDNHQIRVMMSGPQN